MPNAANYDPVRAHDYYMRTRQLKGRKKSSSGSNSNNQSSGSTSTRSSSSSESSASIATVNRLQGKVSALSSALSKARQALSEKRAAETKAKREASDGKSTVEERTASKKYRDKHKEEIAARRKEDTSPEPFSLSSMSVEDLTVRVSRIQSALSEAKRQLSDAMRLSHSIFIDPDLTLGDITLLHSSSRKDAAVDTADADFGGYATRYNLRCSDGRTILAGAFDENDGNVVPLVWQHGHEEPTNVLGHVRLEKRDDGTYAHAYFNETREGQHAKEMVKHKDIRFLSIWANGLVEKVTNAAARTKDVVKGNIREVSLVLGGANPGAIIDNVAIAHGDGTFDTLDEACITTGEEIETAEALSHADADNDEETVQDILDTLDEKQSKAVTYLVSQALATAGSASMEHSETEEGDDAASTEGSGDGDADPAPGTVTSPDSEEQGTHTVVPDDADNNDGSDESNEADGSENSENSENSDGSEDSEGSEGSDDSDAEAGDAAQHTDKPGGQSMSHNVFDQSAGGAQGTRPQVHLSHDDVKAIVDDAQRNGSLKKAVENFIHTKGVTVDGTLQHGIENIEYLFPDAKTLENSPMFVARRMEWVTHVLDGVRKSPFSRIKSITADITPDEARARGYVKGNLKNEEFFEMSKRETTPQTIYKKQKLDRDDVLDIVDLDVVTWLKAEMKVMLDEELAGAILVADGRSNGDEDKIIETKIRPIATDAELYVTTANVNLDDASSSIEELVDSAIAHRRYYKGSGTPTFYTTEGVISSFLTVKDNFGRRLYSTMQEIAAVLRVKDIVPVEVMDRDPNLVGIMVNLSDYTLGADRGGQATMFDDFDLDYNKLLYLIETRVSGALTVPKSALVFRKVAAGDVLVTPTAPVFDDEDSTVTVPTVTGVTYHSGTAAGATLTTGSPVTLADGEELHVVATANANKYFASNAIDEWDFTGVATS